MRSSRLGRRRSETRLSSTPLLVLVACVFVCVLDSLHVVNAEVPHHHEHDRAVVKPASVFRALVSDHGVVKRNVPRMAPHRGVHKWRAINSVMHHINEAYGDGDEEVSPEEWGRFYREQRPKVRLPVRAEGARFLCCMRVQPPRIERQKD